MTEAKSLILEKKDEYIIPLKITKANKTINDLGNEAFPDQLATYHTTYDSSNTNRSSNLELATRKINGIILLPGETFSYNQALGKRTLAAGYKVAGAYAGGIVINEVGGGICQVSSTLYNSVLLSNLEVVTRSNHSLLTGYVPVGRDATVSWGGPEFKFKNNRKYPIKIIASAGKGNVSISIHGVKQSDDYEVEITSYKVSNIWYTTKYINDSSLAQGSQVVSVKGSNGCISETYKILKKNGVQVSKTLISKDKYGAKKQVVRVGTKEPIITLPPEVPETLITIE